MSKGNVFLGTLTHNGQLDFRMARIFYSFASRERAMLQKVQQTSLLASGCNSLWCDALNARAKDNLKWFVLLHADIAPEMWFIDKMIDIAETHDADVLSAVVPIKDHSGVTSTAISGPDDFRRLTRLTQKQINHPAWPATFDIHMAKKAFEHLPHEYCIPALGLRDDNRLLVNTGCMLARLDRLWCSEAHFTINDRIEQAIGGNYYWQVEPEDWFFSRRVAELGGKVFATREIVLEHFGTINYLSNKAWGENVDPSTLTA